MANYKLTYFQIKGLAEPLRFLLSYGNIKFEDERIDRAEWPKHKADYPFGQLPLLTVDGKKYNQSLAIARFIAKKVGLIGKDDIENLEIDAMADTINDLRMKIAAYFFEQDESLKAKKKETLFGQDLPYYLERINGIIAENDGYLACKKLTWVDMYLVGIMEPLNHFLGSDLCEKYPKLEALRKKVLSLPAIRKWLEVRPKTEF